MSTLLAIAAVVLGLPLTLYALQERLIFHPQPISEARRAEIAKRHADVQSVFLQAADGARLHAWHLQGSPGAPLVLYFGGNAEEVSWMIDQARARAPGTEWLLVDYRGYGASAGHPSEAALTADALLWMDYARHTLRAERVVLFGRSLGSGVAVHTAAARGAAGVILVAPFDSLVQLAAHYYPWLPVGWMLRHRFDSLALASGLTMPLLCLVAERDEVIPIVHSKRLYDAWAGPKRWVELSGAGHNSTDAAIPFWEAIRQFVTKKNGPTGPA